MPLLLLLTTGTSPAPVNVQAAIFKVTRPNGLGLEARHAHQQHPLPAPY